MITVGELYEKVNAGHIKSDIDLQREIVYDDEKQRLVIDSLLLGIPLPAFYFWEPEPGIYEVLDGKQRINAMTRFFQNDLMYQGQLWMQTPPEIQGRLKAVELSCIVCSGEDSLKREIFRRINTLGVPLSPFEVLNGLFNGEYLRGVTAYVGSDKGAIKALGPNSRGKNQIRVLKYLLKMNDIKATNENINDWVSRKKGESFAEDQRKVDKLIDFCADIFEDFSLLDIYFDLAMKHMKDKPLWTQHKKEICKRIKAYKKSDDWKLTKTKQKDIEDIILAVVGGIILDPRRLFTASQKAEYLEKFNPEDGKYQCEGCEQWFFEGELTMDHVVAWSKGGRTELSNAQLLCRPCNTTKSNS